MIQRKRIVGRSLLVLIGLFLVFNFYTNRIVGSLLKELVEQKSNGLYHLDYGLLQVNFFTKQLFIRNLTLSLDSALSLELVKDRLIKRNFFEVSVAHAYVGVQDIAAIYFDRHLDITSVKIDQPLFKVASYEALNKKERNEKKENFKADNLQKIILNSLNLFKISDFEMIKGSFEVSHFKHSKTLSYSLNNLSINFNNLQIDSISMQSDKAFFTDTLEINLKDYYLQLADNHHFLKIGEIGISTSDSTIFFKNLVLAPLPNAPPDTTQRPRYHIEIPEFKVSGLHFQKAYTENKIDAQEIHLTKAKIKVQLFKPIQRNKLTNEQIIGTLFKYMKSLKINHFWLDSIALRLERPDSVGNLSFDDISLELHHFQLDSTNWQKQGRHFFSKDIDFSIRNHDFKLPDKLHQLHATEVRASTRRKEIYAKGVSIRPHKNAEKDKTKSTYQIFLPEIWIQGIDFWKARMEADFFAHTIQITKPQIKAYRTESGNSPNLHTFNVLNLYPLIAGNVKSLSVRHFNLQDANFQLIRFQKNNRNELNIKNLTLKFQNFLINAWAHRNPNKIFYSDALEVLMKSHTFDLPDSIHVLKVNDLYLSTAHKELRLGKSEIMPRNNAHEFDPYYNRMEIRFNSLILNEFDFKKAFSEQKFEAGKLFCDQPQIKIQIKRFQDSLSIPKKNNRQKRAIPFSEIVRKLELREMEIRNGSLDFKGREKYNELTIKYFDIKINHFWADTLALSQNRFEPQADSVELKAEGFLALLPKIEHSLKADLIWGSSAKQGLEIDNLVFTPLFPNHRDRTQTHLLFPKLRLEGVDLLKLFFGKKLIANKLDLQNADLFFQLAEKKTAVSSSFSLEKSFFEALKKTGLETQIDSLLMHRSKMVLQNDLQKQITSLEDFDLKIKDLRIRKDLEITPERFMYAQNIWLNVPIFWQETPRNLVWAKNLLFSTEKRSIKIDSAFISNCFKGKLNQTETESIEKTPNFYTLRLAETQAEGFDFFHTFINKKLKISELKTKNPLLQYSERQAKNSRKKGFEWDSLSLYPYIRSLLYSVDLDTLKLENLTFERNFWKEQEQKKEIWKKIDANIRNLYIDSAAKQDWKQPFFAKNIDLRMRDYEIPLKDSLYRLKTKAIGIRTAEKILFIDTLEYVPLYSKEDFWQKKGVQAARMEVRLDKTELIGLDLAKLLKNKELRAKKMNLEDLLFSAYMDRRPPPPPATKSLDAPWTMLSKMKQVVDIDSFSLSGLDIFYEERTRKSPKTGTLTLENGKLEIANLTNDSAKMVNKMQVRFSTELMGEGELYASGSFPLADSDRSYSFIASMGKMDMTLFNQYLEKPYGVKISRGEAQQLQFWLKGNQNVSYGKMNLGYKRLKIALIDLKTEQSQGFKVKALSFLANAFFLRHNRSSFKKRHAEIYVERNPEKPVYSMLLKALTAGLKMSIGINDAKMRKTYREKIR